MKNIQYANAYKEVIEILKFIPIEDYNKIPRNRIRLFETNSNKEYNFVYDPNKSLDEQNVSKRAKAIIAILFRDYWANDFQRKKLLKKQEDDRIKLEKEKKEKFSTENLFKSKLKKDTQFNEQNKEAEMIEYKESVIRKIINKILDFLHLR